MSRSLTMMGRIVVGGLHNFLRNASLSIAAMAVMVVTLSIVLFSFIANQTFNHTIQDIRDRIDISVYLKDEVTPEQRESLIAELKQNSNVREVEYVTKEQAREEFLRANEDEVELQLTVTEIDNPLPASLRIRVYNADLIDDLRAFVERPDIKALQSDETSYSGSQKEAIDKIARATTFIRQAGAIGVLVFAAVSVLIIFNTIQMAIFNRRDELSIMRLLGASRFYIRGPFLIESMMIGIFAALISVGLCKFIFSVATDTLGASTLGFLDLQYSENLFADNFWAILGVQLGLGIFIGFTSSFIATQRYLRLRHTK